jgi:hypothetical protein
MSIQAIDTKAIVELQKLPENWDGYGAASISGTALGTLHRIILVPCVNGGWQLEWHANGADVEISVDASGRIDGFCFGPLGHDEVIP